MSVSNTQNAPQKWLFVVLIYADFTNTNPDPAGDLALGLNSLFNDILETPLSADRCRLFILMDSISSNVSAGQVFIRNRIARYEICKSQGQTNIVKECKIYYDSCLNAKQLLSKSGTYHRHIFQQGVPLGMLLQTIEVGIDEEILFVTWDHGAGYGIFRDEVELTQRKPSLSLDESLISYPTLEYFFHGNYPVLVLKDFFLEAEKSSLELEVPDILTNADLAIGLSDWLKKNRKDSVGVLLMMNCWMMNIHTMYAAKDVATCLVAPQTAIGNPGYNYISILTLINHSRKRCKPEDVAVHCVTSRHTSQFISKVKSLGLPVKDTVDNCLVFAIKLRYANTQTNAFDRQIAALKVLIEKLFEVVSRDDANGVAIKHLIQYSRAVMFDLSDGYNEQLIDIYHYFYFLSEINNSLETIEPIVSANLMEVVTAFLNEIKLNKLMLGLYDLNKEFPINAQQDFIIPKPTGYSIFFRLSSVISQKLQYCINVDELLKGDLSKWLELLNVVFGK